MSKIRKDALSERVYDSIKQMILDGVLVPHKKISKKDLAEMIDVSQTPVNEALNRLIGEGLVEQRSREGYFLRTFSYGDLRDLFVIRAGLEGIAVRLCVEELEGDQLDSLLHYFEDFSVPMSSKEMKRYLKVDQNFHRKLVELSGNSMLINYERSYHFLLKSYQNGLIRPPEETLEEHRNIINSIRLRDAHMAQEFVVQHLMNSKKFIVNEYLS